MNVAPLFHEVIWREWQILAVKPFCEVLQKWKIADIFFKDLFLLFLIMCVYLCAVYVHVCAGAQRGHEALDPPEPGLTGACGPPNVSAGNLARLLMKSSTCP